MGGTILRHGPDSGVCPACRRASCMRRAAQTTGAHLLCMHPCVCFHTCVCVRLLMCENKCSKFAHVVSRRETRAPRTLWSAEIARYCSTTVFNTARDGTMCRQFLFLAFLHHSTSTAGSCPTRRRRRRQWQGHQHRRALPLPLLR